MIKYFDKIGNTNGLIYLYKDDGLTAMSLESLVTKLDICEREKYREIYLLNHDSIDDVNDSIMDQIVDDIYELKSIIESISRYRILIISGNLDEIFTEICFVYSKSGGYYVYSFDMRYIYDNPEFEANEMVHISENFDWKDSGGDIYTDNAIVLGDSDFVLFPRELYPDGNFGYRVAPADINGEIIGDEFNILMPLPSALLN